MKTNKQNTSPPPLLHPSCNSASLSGRYYRVKPTSLIHPLSPLKDFICNGGGRGERCVLNTSEHLNFCLHKIKCILKKKIFCREKLSFITELFILIDIAYRLSEPLNPIPAFFLVKDVKIHIKFTTMDYAAGSGTLIR